MCLPASLSAHILLNADKIKRKRLRALKFRENGAKFTLQTQSIECELIDLNYELLGAIHNGPIYMHWFFNDDDMPIGVMV